MDKINTLRDLIDRENKFAIAVTSTYTIDEMGAALALYLTLNSIGKDVSIVSAKAPIVEVSSLVGIDKVKTSFDSGSSSDLTVSFPYQEGEIGKVSYTLENGFLNILVKAGPKGIMFNDKDVIFRKSSQAPAVVISIGVSSLSDLSKIFNLESLKDVSIVNIDNSSENQGYGDIVMVNVGSSSVSEDIANIILGLGLRIDVDASQNLLSGISFSTHNFSDSKTTPMAFEMAAVLMRNGARRGKNRENRPNEIRDNRNIRNFKPNQLPQSNNRQNQPSSRAENQQDFRDPTPPEDWLEPKIFKGSTDVS